MTGGAGEPPAASARKTIAYLDYEVGRGTLSGAPAGTLSGAGSGTLSGAGTGAGTGTDEGFTAPDLEPERELGRGGMGIIWLARQKSLRREVAVKTLRPDLAGGPSARHFESEALVTGRLEHPNIPPVHTYGADEAGRPFLCMKLVKGLEWARLLAPETPEESARAAKIDLTGHLKIIQRVCEALAFAHANGVIHRDLKPENIMVGAFGEVQVMDWGIALEMSGAGTGTTGGLRRPVGTPAYMAPEMAVADEAKMGPWTDVYLTGGLLYELLTGAPPHEGESVLAVLVAAEKDPVRPPAVRAPDRKIPDELAEIAMRALAPDPARRFEGTLEIARAIDEYLKNEASRELAREAATSLAAIGAAALARAAPPPEIYSRFTACTAELEQALKLWSENRAARAGLVDARLAYAAYAVGERDLSIAETQLRDVPPENPRTVELRGRIAAARAEDAAEALRRKRIGAAVAGLVVAVIVALVFVFRETRRAHTAERAKLRRANAVSLTQGDIWKSLAERIADCERALAVDDTWSDGFGDLGRAFVERAYDLYMEDPPAARADLDRALAALDRAVALNAKDPNAVADRGYLHEMRGEWPLARLDYERTIAIAPASHPGREAAMQIAYSERRYADAEREASAAIELAGEETDFFRRSIARFILGDLDGALKDARQAETIESQRSDEWYQTAIALVLLARGEDVAAGEKLVEAMRDHACPPHVLPLLAYVAAKHGDLDRARALEAWARKEQAARVTTYLGLDPVWLAAKSAPAPRDELGRALVLEQDLAAVVPKEAPRSLALRRKGETRLAAGDHAAALGLAQRALADDPADGSARLLRARCLLALGHRDAARADLELAARLAPNRAEEARAVLAGLGDKR